MPSPMLLSHLPQTEPPSDLLQKIMLRIHTAKMRRIYAQLSAAAAGTVLSVVYITSSWSVFATQIRESSFWAMLKLLWSDPDIAFSNISNLALGLSESIPLDSVLLALILCFSIFAFLWITSALRHETRRSLFNQLT